MTSNDEELTTVALRTTEYSADLPLGKHPILVPRNAFYVEYVTSIS